MLFVSLGPRERYPLPFPLADFVCLIRQFKSKPKALSNDHQPLLDRERIEKAGGWIDPDGMCLFFRSDLKEIMD